MERKEEPMKNAIKNVVDQVKQTKDTVQNSFEKHPLVVLKLFYFFALSSFSLKVVYMPLYFKQVGLPALYAGILAGLPPFIRGFGALLLGMIADKLKKRRILFLISLVANATIPLLCLIPRVEYPVCDVGITEEPVTDPLGMPLEVAIPDGPPKSASAQVLYRVTNISRPAPNVQIEYYSKIDNVTYNRWSEPRTPVLLHHLVRRSTARNLILDGKSEKLGIFELYSRTYGRRSDILGKKTSVVSQKSNISNKISGKGSQTNHPHKKTPQESQDMLFTIFMTLLVLLIIGEFLGGPLRSLADLSVLEAMDGDKANYGDVALWMQVGKIFLAPMILVLIRTYSLHVCDKLKDNYEYSLYPLSAFIAFSFVFAQSIRFKRDEEDPKERMKNTESEVTLFDVLFTFKTFTILVLSFFAGGLSAVHYTFIFWYLTDLSPKDSGTVIAVVIVLRDIVSSIAYKFSGKTLGLLGPTNTLHLALLLYIISFLSYAVMENPWFAIIPEVIQYIVFPLAYSSFVVYLGQNTPDHLNATVQGI